MNNYPKEFMDLLLSVTSKRPKTVIDHILKHGHITTEELKEQYGYNHPPRAVRDVRELGIPLETFKVIGTDGRTIAAYRFGEFKAEVIKRFAGRTALSKKIKTELIARYGSKCFIYNEQMAEKDLQIDHRVPYEVDGDGNQDFNVDDYMLLSGSANRAKSWSCEQCENWINQKNKTVCLSCYWAFPENYSHIAMKQIRRVDLIWQGKEIDTYEKIKNASKNLEKDIQIIIKEIIEKEFK